MSAKKETEFSETIKRFGKSAYVNFMHFLAWEDEQNELKALKKVKEKPKKKKIILRKR